MIKEKKMKTKDIIMITTKDIIQVTIQEKELLDLLTEDPIINGKEEIDPKVKKEVTKIGIEITEAEVAHENLMEGINTKEPHPLTLEMLTI